MGEQASESLPSAWGLRFFRARQANENAVFSLVYISALNFPYFSQYFSYRAIWVAAKLTGYLWPFISDVVSSLDFCQKLLNSLWQLFFYEISNKEVWAEKIFELPTRFVKTFSRNNENDLLKTRVINILYFKVFLTTSLSEGMSAFQNDSYNNFSLNLQIFSWLFIIF